MKATCLGKRCSFRVTVSFVNFVCVCGGGGGGGGRIWDLIVVVPDHRLLNPLVTFL